MNHTDPQMLFETPDVESSTEDYAGRFRGAVGRWFLDVQNRAAMECLEGVSAEDLLDVGGGHGQTLDALTERGFRVTVLGSRDCCRRRIQPRIDAGRAEFVVANLVALPFKDGAFEAGLSFRMLTHLKAWRLLVSELCRVSRERVVVDFPVYRSANFLAESLFFLKKGIEKNTRHYRLFHENEVVREFEKHGFSPFRRVPQYFVPMAVHRLVGRAGFSSACEDICRRAGLRRFFGSPLIFAFQKRRPGGGNAEGGRGGRTP
jgi:ubiquinone/menaquinone biosynthesis C-methylase UbiE